MTAVYCVSMLKNKCPFDIQWTLVWCIIFSLTGCGKQEYSHREKLPEPSFVIHFDGENEKVEYLGMESCPISPESTGFTIKRFIVNGNDVSIRLLDRKPDDTIKGNTLMNLIITGNGDSIDLPTVSWDGKSDLPITFGDGWMIILTSYDEKLNH